MVSGWQLEQTESRRGGASVGARDERAAWECKHDVSSASAQCTRGLFIMSATRTEWHSLQRAIPSCLSVTGLPGRGSTWHCEHIFAATGGWTVSCSMPLRADPCGSWQPVQVVAATGYPACARVSDASAAWHDRHSFGSGARRSLAAVVEACASWQVPHPFATGSCGCFLPADAAIDWWQLAQSSALLWRRRDSLADACAS